jgi:hypothetical protein
MWLVRYQMFRYRLFHDYINAVRFFNQQDSDTIQIQLYKQADNEYGWESLTWKNPSARVV